MEKLNMHDHLPEVVMNQVSAMLSLNGNLQEAYEIATEAITQVHHLAFHLLNIIVGSCIR